MTDIKVPPEPTSEAAAAGIGFDAHVKCWINQYQQDLFPGQRLMTDPMVMIKDGIADEDLQIKANIIGRNLLLVYIQGPGLDILEHCPIKVEMDETQILPGYNVPLRCKIDALLQDNTVLDWKVRGYASAAKSPTQGYFQRWKGGKHYPDPHDKHTENFEVIERKWATQLAIYAFSVGHIPGEPLIGKIDELSMRDVMNPEEITIDSVACTQLRLPIGRSFQLEVAEELRDTWNKITTDQIEVPIPTYKRCYQYRKLCQVASSCTHYLKIEDIIQSYASSIHSKPIFLTGYDKMMKAFTDSEVPPEPV